MSYWVICILSVIKFIFEGVTSTSLGDGSTYHSELNMWVIHLSQYLCIWFALYCAFEHYCEVIMGAMTSQITSLTIVYSIVHSVADQRKHQSSASLAFVQGIHRWPVNSPHKWPVTRKMFPLDDVIMIVQIHVASTGTIHECPITCETILGNIGM